MRFEAGYFRTQDGADMFFRHWRPDSAPRGIVLVAHGLGEHSGRYQDFARHANERGYEVFAMDHRGHGRSAGKRGHIDRFEQFVQDMRVFWLRFCPTSDVPTFLVGQSMGALIALHYASHYAEDLAGLALCSGAFSMPDDLPRWKVTLGRLLLRIRPSFTMDHGLNPQCISKEEQVLIDYLDDPYVHTSISVRLFFELERAMREARTVATRMHLPLLVMYGTDDCAVPQQGSKEIYDLWAGGNKQIIQLEGVAHDIFHGSKAQETFDTLLNWFDDRVGMKSKTSEERVDEADIR